VREGFYDNTGYYGMTHKVSGTWLSDEPLGANEGAHGDVVLAVDLELAEGQLSPYEVIEAGKPYREFVFPARLLNEHAQVTVSELDCLGIFKTARRPPIAWIG
jgi:hypothetical protein